MFHKVSILNRLYLTLIFLSCIHIAYSQTTGDYRSNAASLNWTTTASWQRWNGAAWAAPGANGYPGQLAVPGLVTIQNAHTVTLNVTPANNIGSLTVGGGTSGTLNTTDGVVTLTLNGNMTISAGGSVTLGVAGGTDGNLNIGGTTLINGTFTDNVDNAGTNTFAGLSETYCAGTYTQ
jgi:hypothetical protein